MARPTSNPTKRLEKAVQDRIGEYQVIEQAGSGGMATVWRVKGPGGKVHALKEMRPQSQAKREMTRRFKQEFEVTSRLSHRNIVRVHDFFAAHDTLHIVMEWVDGPDLRDVVRYAGLLDQGRLALIGAEIASGLSSAHAQGVLHRDLKPENILMNRRGQLKITDFGVARVTGTRLTATGIIVGSPAYMSPEQLSGVSGQKLSTAADIYSLGVLLYELGEGRDPLGLRKHEDLLTVLRTKREKRPRPMRRITHEGLGKLILSFLEQRVEDRPADTERIARDLRRIARELGAVRADIEFLVATALTNRGEKKKAGGTVAPERPSNPRVAQLKPGGSSADPAPWAADSARSPRQRGVASVTPTAPRARRSPRRRKPAKVPEQAWDGADPSAADDFGSGSRRLSRADQLSVKRRAARGEGIGAMSWIALILFGAVVIFLGVSASLTGSPLGLLEALVPLP